ncbi:MAG: rhodanese-like domain-containing protein [Candidatus Electrothrix sp. GW3-4]|uniref:rhodanese-like domain-containing protein n=1 Tax=Candidatus Electrothrix sp. GW3-4 TaxID=3126740 RepID=UPI0030D5FD71
MAVAIGLCMSVASAAWSYDTQQAESYAKMFAPAEGIKVGKELHFINPDGFIKNLQAGKEYVAIDVRTSGEAAMVGLIMPGSMVIPLNELFKEENLKRVPTDKMVVIICKSGARATAAGTALRHIGFDNVYILKGGLQALSTAYGPREGASVTFKK